MSEARLRPWRPADTPALITVFRDSVRLSPAYPAAVRHVWAPDDIDTAAWNDRQTRHWTHV
ncbi:MAG: GNAT family N-acetyltransferase, partial [Pseudomonadota bacterium]|nr:GNAT family N-acetyltransferase [Pseudomonadota bacterium]